MYYIAFNITAKSVRHLNVVARWSMVIKSQRIG